MDSKLHELYEDYKQLLQTDHQIVGIGVTAFNRIAPAFFLPNYQIISYKEGSDSPAIKKLTTLKSIQKDFIDDGDIDRLNSLSILRHPGVQKYLKNLSQTPSIFLYRTTERTDKLCAKNSWQVLANDHSIRDQFEDKDQFFHIGRKIGLPMIKGKQIKLKNLDKGLYQKLTNELGPKLVFQIVDFSKGGGKGTFFINSYYDILSFKKSIEQFKIDKPTSEWQTINVTQFITGPSPSITGCTTRHGILTGPVQTQILDVPELLGGREPGGVYQGHDWTFTTYDQNIQSQAEKITTTLGEHMYSLGYKGIFGVDLVIDENTQKVYPVECNPRYTGAFPVYSLLQHAYQEIPLDVFQLLELLNIDYPMDFDLVNQSWKTPKVASHFSVHNPFYEYWAKATGDLPAGVYKLNKGKLTKVRDNILFQDLKNESEFILTDGPPVKDQLVKPGLRCGKLIFKRGVLTEHAGLNEFTKQVVKAVYRGFNFKKVKIDSD